MAAEAEQAFALESVMGPPSLNPVTEAGVIPPDETSRVPEVDVDVDVDAFSNPQPNHSAYVDYLNDDPEVQVQEDDSAILEIQLEKDITLILKLMPDRTYDEVRLYLETYRDNPSRVQVIKSIFILKTGNNKMIEQDFAIKSSPV